MFPFFKTFASLPKARLLSLLFLCAVVAVGLAASFALGLGWLTGAIGYWETGWLNTLSGWITGLLGGVVAWFMLPTLVVLIAGVFQETVIARVEKAYYPERQRTEPPRLWPDIVHDIRFTLRVLVLNLLLVPFYFLGIGFVLSIALNSYLLGREFFESAAGYHLGKKQALALGQKNRGPVYLGGLVITLGSLVPVLNLIIPVLAVVWMTHLYHSPVLKKELEA